MRHDDPGSCSDPAASRLTGALSRVAVGYEASARPGSMLARLYRSLAEFTVLTDHVRSAVDERLAAQVEVTGWSDGVLRIRLATPALATRWRFQEPAVLRHLSRIPAYRGLRSIRLVTASAPSMDKSSNKPRRVAAPAGVLRAMAAAEPHDGLRRALEALAAAAEEET